MWPKHFKLLKRFLRKKFGNWRFCDCRGKYFFHLALATLQYETSKQTKMANFVRSEDNFRITIPRWETRDNCTYYCISIQVGDVYWTVEHRYNDFYKLHEYLESNYSFATGIFPPKTLIINRRKDFIEKRRTALENYIVSVVNHLQKTIPKPLAHFLDFNKYDILFIVKELASQFYLDGETILMKVRHYTFTPLQIFAIGERMKQPCTSLDVGDQSEDFSHVLEFCSQLTEAIIVGNDDPVPGSNIIHNKLPLQFTMFKSLQRLTLRNIDPSQMMDLGLLRQTLSKLKLTTCPLSQNLCSIFLCDQTHKSTVNFSNENNHWVGLTDLTINEMPLRSIDGSTHLLPNLRSLNIVDNALDNFENFDSLQKLTHLDLSNNKIQMINSIQLNSLVSLNLSQNQLKTLEPFSNLLVLETLNLQSNSVNDIEVISYVTHLPSLENLVLSGNPVSMVVDYRIKVLAMFGTRAFRICLDNETTNQRELDKVAILKALKSCREGLPYSVNTP